MEIIKLKNEKFPDALLEIPQPPKQLYLRGELPDENAVYLAVVGSRRCTSYGRDACEKLIRGLRGYPVVIISGLAMGIDTIAHKAALDAGLKTVSFPGSGLKDTALHPKINIGLARQIVESGGCLLSEFEPDAKAADWCFPMRNRLMAGLSKAVLIIEAEDKSGTLITARLATDYNRDVLVVPGSINSPTSKGTNRLIRQGATPITCPEDLLLALGFEIEQNEEKQAKLFADCSPAEKKIIDLLREPMTRDEIIRSLGLPTPEVSATLSVMEIKGLIKEIYGEISLI